MFQNKYGKVKSNRYVILDRDIKKIGLASKLLIMILSILTFVLSFQVYQVHRVCSSITTITQTVVHKFFVLSQGKPFCHLNRDLAIAQFLDNLHNFVN